MAFSPSVVLSNTIGGEIATSVRRRTVSATASTLSLSCDAGRLPNSGAVLRDDGRLGGKCNCHSESRGRWISVGVKSRRLNKRLAAPRSDGGGWLSGNRGSQGKPMNISPPGLGQFKPPPTAYVPPYQESEEEKIHAATRGPVLIAKLRDGAGTWQERAGFVKELQQLGVTSEELYSMTFVPIVKQLEIVVAAQVYDSLTQSGASPEVLQQLDEFSMGLLYALRTLSAAQRKAAVEYALQNSLTIEEAEKLAWAIKDHQRRPAGRKGFSTAPGDCLAFMYHRQANESRDIESRQEFVELGLKVAVTDSARNRFSEFS